MAEHCQHCDSLILDPTRAVHHGPLTFCCTNCASAMEQGGSGSDPHAGRHENELFCTHCGSPITDESTLVSRGDDPFCCDNCLAMAA